MQHRGAGMWNENVVARCARSRGCVEAEARASAGSGDRGIASYIGSGGSELPPAFWPRRRTRRAPDRNALDPTEKSLIFDGFVALSPNVSLLMTWPSAGLRFSSNGTANPVEPALRVEAFEVGIISFGFKCLMSKSLDYQLHQSFNQASEFIRGLITVWF